MSRVEQIWRYAVKSMAGERLAETAVGERGVTGDRAWVVRDEESAAICGAKTIGGLMRLAAAYSEAPTAAGSSAVTIRFEDGSKAHSSDVDINDRLGKALGRRVTLCPLIDPANKDHYKRAKSLGNMTESEFRDMLGRIEGEPLPDVGQIPPEFSEYECPIGTYFDVFSLLIVTSRSLETMQERAPGSRFDVRRFRTNLLLDNVDSDDPFPEFAWAGRRASLGTAIFRLARPCVRCVMATRGFQDLEADPKIMRALVKETGGTFGIGASVETPGIVREGDSFTLLD